MNKQERFNKFNKLRWKYFWKQKFKEIGKFTTGIVAMVSTLFLFPYFVGKGLYLFLPEEFTTPDLLSFWIAGIIVTCFLGVIGWVTFEIIKGIIHWLKNNMKEAETKAWKELK